MARAARKARGTSPSDGPKKRGRPAKAPPSVAAAALNGNVPDETYKMHLDKVGALRVEMKQKQEELNAARGSYRAALKVAKQDGVNADAIAASFAEREKDQLERKVFYRDFGRCLRLLGVPLGTQLGLFDQDASVKAMEGDGPMTEELAEKLGHAACRAHEPNSNNPHEAGTELYVAWRRGWNLAAEEAFTAKKPAARGIGQSSVTAGTA